MSTRPAELVRQAQKWTTWREVVWSAGSLSSVHLLRERDGELVLDAVGGMLGQTQADHSATEQQQEPGVGQGKDQLGVD